jgi:drug/metabolite transporter (DMT)-like permease
MSSKPNAFHIALIFSLSTLSFAIMNALGKYLENYSTIQIIFFRNFIAFIFVYSIMILRKRTHFIKTKRLKDHFWRGIFGLGSMYCIFASIKYLPLAEVSAISRTEPIILAILSMIFLGEKPERHRWIAIIFGLVGVLVMLNPTGLASSYGLFFALSHAILTACAMLMVRKLGKTETTDTIVFYFMLWGTLVTLLFLPFYWQKPNWTDSLIFLAIGIFGVLGQLLMVLGYRKAEASFIAGLNYTQIIWSAIIGYIFWSEVPRVTVIIGAFIILISQTTMLVYEKKRTAINDLNML